MTPHDMPIRRHEPRRPHDGMDWRDPKVQRIQVERVRVSDQRKRDGDADMMLAWVLFLAAVALLVWVG